MMPKSIAPMEIRLAESPRNTMTMNVNRSDRGIERATTSDARKSPRKASRMNATNTMPSSSV